MEPEVTLSLELMSSAESCCHLGHLAHHTGTSRLAPYSRRRFRQWKLSFASLSRHSCRDARFRRVWDLMLSATWRCNLEPSPFCELTLGRARPAARFECDDLRTQCCHERFRTSRSIVLANYCEGTGKVGVAAVRKSICWYPPCNGLVPAACPVSGEQKTGRWIVRITNSGSMRFPERIAAAFQLNQRPFAPRFAPS